MEQQQNESLNLFGLSIDATSKVHLGEAARWAKFLAIIGFIFIAFFILIALFFGSFFAAAMSSSPNMYGESLTSGMGTIVSVVYIVIALIYFFPCLFLFKFASKMKVALATNEQDTLNVSFQNLKAMFRFVGILTILFLVIWVLFILTAVLGAASAGF